MGEITIPILCNCHPHVFDVSANATPSSIEISGLLASPWGCKVQSGLIPDALKVLDDFVGWRISSSDINTLAHICDDTECEEYN